jgi:uncharacterized protein (UPF0264 family)
LVLVGYADDPTTVTRAAIVEVAAGCGASGVLLDTADKNGPGLIALVARDALRAWVARAHTHGLIAAVAGKLTADDLPAVHQSGADIAGVRGAACDGGRNGRVSADRVRQLRVRCVGDHGLVVAAAEAG